MSVERQFSKKGTATVAVQSAEEHKKIDGVIVATVRLNESYVLTTTAEGTVRWASRSYRSLGSAIS
jgi:coenzyme F420-reducing hydrogenase beta subunit